MNTKRIVSLLLLMLASAFGSQAATIFDVQVDTSTFLGAGLGFNVQLNGGGGSSVLLSDFFFGGGAPLDPPVTFGGASGDLRSSVTLRTAEFFNDFTQPFLAGALLRFRISFAPSPADPPDGFSFVLLDQAGFELPTDSPVGGLLVASLTSRDDVQIDSFGATNGAVPAPIVTTPGGGPVVVPEPASALLAGSALLALSRIRRSRSSRPR